MKSLIEEASSISKAIEKGWIRAGKPRNFSIKIYEEPEKNFFGLTTKSAKVALVFDEKTVTVPAEKSSNTQHTAQRPEQKRQVQQHQKQQRATTQPKERETQVDTQKSKKEQPRAAEFSDEMKEAVTSWLGDTLRLMDMPSTTFSLHTSDQFVRVLFSTKLVEDSNQEKLLFRSLSYLMIASLRNKFKKSLRGLKLVLASA